MPCLTFCTTITLAEAIRDDLSSPVSDVDVDGQRRRRELGVYFCGPDAAGKPVR